MPTRRASAAAQNIASAASRVHKSNGSNHSVSGPSSLAPSNQNAPYSSSPLPATPQQKVVYVLVNRLKSKLPCNSGIAITDVEGDEALQQVVESLVELSRDSLDIIGWALTELLEKLNKQADPHGFRSVEVLQSQLFILKILAICMASRWGKRQDGTRPTSRTSKEPPSSVTSKPTTPEVGTLSSQSRRPQWSTEHLSVEPPPLDDNCAKYILSVMVLLLRQTAPLKRRLMSAANMDFAATHHDFESVETPEWIPNVDFGGAGLPLNVTLLPRMFRSKHASSNSLNSTPLSATSTSHSKHSLVYEKTSVVTSKSISALNTLISRFAGRVVYHLSASNWRIVLSRIRTKIHYLANATEPDPDIIDLQLMMHSALDRARLIQTLQELSSLLLNIKQEAQAAIAVPLRAAIWNWIDLFPEEFNDIMRHHRRMDGAPERVFDILYDSQEATHNPNVWPTLIALACISPERMKKSDFQPNSIGMPIYKGHQNRRDRALFEIVMRNIASQNAKVSEEALICVLDICRAAFRVQPEENVEHGVQMFANDIAHELKRVLVNWNGTKPYWEWPEEIDVAIIADILITLFRYVADEEVIPLFKLSLEPERSDAVKISTIKACITIIEDASKCPWQRSHQDLMDALRERFGSVLATALTRRSELDPWGNVKKPALRPKAKRYTSETLPDRELLAYSLLALYRIDPTLYVLSLEPGSESQWMKVTIESWHAPTDPAIKMGMAKTFRRWGDAVMRLPRDHPKFEVGCAWLAIVSPTLLATLCTNLLVARTDMQAQRMWINMAYELVYNFAKPGDTEPLRCAQQSTHRPPAFAVAEIAFLVALTSADANVTLTAAHCLRLLAQAQTAADAPATEGVNEDERAKRYPIYEQLGDPKVMIVGRIGHQKRVRKLMRLMPSTSPVHIAVWEECYWRWCALNEMAVRRATDGSMDGFESGVTPVGERALSSEEIHAQWQNLTLFLASFGSACLRDDDSSQLSLDIAPFLLPDEMRILRNPADLLQKFLGELIDFLVSDSIQTRDTARDALGCEASPRLFTKIFRELDSVVRELAASETVDWDTLALFLDQFLVILKVLVENAQYLEEIRTMDLGSTLAVIASFMGRFHAAISYRLRMKFCTLCEGVFSQGELIAMRKDSSNRQRIADIVTEWIQDPASSDPAFTVQQRDLNMAAFRATAKLFDRLELQSPDGTTGEEAAHVVSRIFVRYTGVLFKAWDLCRYDLAATDDRSTDRSTIPGLRSLQRDGELRELVVTGYASLVSANPEVGVKHSLPLAYEADSAKRLIFSYVFTRVLPQGISLDSQEQPTVVPRQSRLCELVKGPDLSLALAICEVCPASEVDSLISVMLNLFDTRSALMTLLKNMIDLEVSRTDSDTALFRGNTTCTRFLSAFANIYGYNYLRSLIIPLIKTMASMPPGHGYELDPAKVGEEVAAANRETIQFITSSFLQIILSSIPAVPPMLREVCAHIAKVVNEVWPEAKFAAVGAFMFLRFISPAIVAPEIIDVEIPKDDWVLRRGLMLVAKIIQNLANNIFFGKEPHMVALNDFLKENIVNVTRFLSDLNKTGPSFSEEEPEEWLDTTYDDTDTIVLHRFLEKHADRVGKELLSTSKPPPTTDPLSATTTAEMTAAHAKRIWDSLCAALVELGQPLEGPKLTLADSQQHSEYLDLMSRYEHRDTSSVQGLFVEIPMPAASKAIFVLAVSRIDVEILDIELLLFYVFKTVTTPPHEHRDYDIIFDFTCFTLASQLPLQWLKFAYEVIPADIRSRLDTAHILTPNLLATKYLKRVYNLSSGIELFSNHATYSSVNELINHLPQVTTLPTLDYALSLEAEPRTRFDEVTMRHTHPMRVPVSLEVAQNHLRITTLKALPIGGAMSCRATDIISLTEINDVYNVSTGHETHEFIIRKTRHGTTMYFSSLARDSIVKAIRSAKSTLRTIQLPGTERRSRFSNVVATLLHVGMLGINSREEDVRIAANELLQAVCTYLDFEGKPLVASKTSLVNGLPEPFLIQLSEGLASFAPHLTLDFVTEVSSGMNREAVQDRALCILYMTPWLKNLACFLDPTNKLYDPSTTKFRDCIRILVDLTIADNELHGMVLKHIWAEIGRLDSCVVNAVLDELMRAAVDGGVSSVRCERVADTMGAITSINVRGRILSRLRKVVGKTSTKPTKSLADNAHWNEISCLLRLALVAGHHCKNVVQSQLFIPETAHLVTLTAATGQTYVRTAVHGIVVNLLNALYNARLAETAASPELQQLIGECEQPETLRLFGLLRPTPTSDYVNLDPSTDKLYVDNMESLVRFLARVLETIAGSKGLLNVWHARWMSLITSSAFQLSPAVQTRAFVSLGVLATSDVDDDLLYQMLVAFKTALSQSSENETTSVVSMLRCIRNVVPALPRYSRYLCQLFWLAVALLQSSHLVLYVEAVHLLRVSVEVMDSQGAFEEKGVAATLLDGRAALEEVACQLDQLLGLSLESNFSFSLAAIIFKGIRQANLRDPAEAALRALMRITVRTCGEVEHADDGPGSPICQQILGYFLALIPTSTTTIRGKRLLEETGVDPSWLSHSLLTASSDDDPIRRIPFALLGLSDANTVLFVTSFVGAISQTAQGDDTETEILCNMLSDIADAFPDVVSMAYESLQDRIKDAFANSANPAILSAVSNLFRVAVHDAERNGTAPGSASSLSFEDGQPHGPGRSHLLALEEQGMQGLANSFQFLPPNQGHATKMMNWISELVMKIIE